MTQHSFVLLFTAAAAAAMTCPNVTLVYLPAFSQINASLAADNIYGIEDGRVVRTSDGVFHLVVAEMYADPKWVAMRLAMWSGSDAWTWSRTSTLRTSSGNTTGADPRAALWGPSVVFDSDTSTWALLYVSYYSAPSNASGWLGNFYGQIWLAYAETGGEDGINGPFTGDRIILSPDPSVKYAPWQGLQGTDSFFAWKRYDEPWLGFYGTAHTETPNVYPEEWVVGLAAADALDGAWVRQPVGAPTIVNLTTGGFSENPIVEPIPGNIVDNYYVVVYDLINEEGSAFGLSCSEDGVAWNVGAAIDVPGGARTPFGLIPMTASDVRQHAAELSAAGVDVSSAAEAADAVARREELLKTRGSNHSKQQLPTVTSAMYWLFYSVQEPGWEVMRSAIVQLTFA